VRKRVGRSYREGEKVSDIEGERDNQVSERIRGKVAEIEIEMVRKREVNERDEVSVRDKVSVRDNVSVRKR
jgi:hypothetical protein